MPRMAARWCDTDIAASLNRMGIPTGQGKTWTARGVASIRKVHGMHAYRSAEKNGAWLTMSEAAAKLGVSNHVIRAAEQVVSSAPYQIRAADLETEQVTAAIQSKHAPCPVPENQLAFFPGT